MKNNITIDSCFGYTKKELFDICASSPFPGTSKWPAEHPIWNCNITGKLSPKEAWIDEECLNKAIDNLFWILNRCVDGFHKEYPEFVESHRKAFSQIGLSMLEKVLNRFTIAKIAPKVTALSESLFYKAIIQSNLDISSGVYCPMAGFGGIVRASKKWLLKHNILNIDKKLYAADINKNFCDWYGWINKDVLSEVVTTDKTVCVCPPFGDKTERWNGTPKSMYKTFEEWVKLIVDHIHSPQYIFIGPNEVERKENGICVGLFGRKSQARYYVQSEIDKILGSVKEKS